MPPKDFTFTIPTAGIQLSAIMEEDYILNDNVNHPKHYEGTVECIDMIVETQGVEYAKAFCVCNAFKYLYRHKRKNSEEDIEKARWYLNEWKELKDGEEEEIVAHY